MCCFVDSLFKILYSLAQREPTAYDLRATLQTRDNLWATLQTFESLRATLQTHENLRAAFNKMIMKQQIHKQHEYVTFKIFFTV